MAVDPVSVGASGGAVAVIVAAAKILEALVKKKNNNKEKMTEQNKNQNYKLLENDVLEMKDEIKEIRKEQSYLKVSIAETRKEVSDTKEFMKGQFEMVLKILNSKKG